MLSFGDSADISPPADRFFQPGHKPSRTGQLCSAGSAVVSRREHSPVKEQENLNLHEEYVGEISLDSAAYLENNETIQSEENQEQPEASTKEGVKDNEQHTPQLFSEDGKVDSFNKETNDNEDSESLINDEEEDFEIPAFLRKQKN